MGLAKRVIPTLLLDHGKLVKGEKFHGWRVVGNPVQAARVHNLREVDELLVFDISATREGRPPDYATIEKIARVNFVPLTVGGGIRDVGDVRTLLRSCGADKIALGSRSLCVPGLAEAIGAACGCQIVVGVVSADHVSQVQRAAEVSGEIVLQSVERDGTMAGYNLELISRVANSVSVPVVASSGCGSYADMDAALSAGADAVAAGALWQFTEATPLKAKEYLQERGWEVRL